jgi:glycosyltransferase involved in cell wall biosynthesis
MVLNLLNTDKLKTPIKVLLIGPLMNDIGGTTISFKYLLDELRKTDDVSIDVLTVKGIRGCGWRAVPVFIKLISSIALLTPKHDIVSLQVSVTAASYIGPFVLGICRLLNRPLIYRMFGGMDHNGLCGLQKVVAGWFAKNVNMYLVQTKILLQSSIVEGFSNGKWFPTSRPVSTPPSIIKKKCRRFVFVGQLRPEKGLKELSEAAEKLPEGLEVHVWGPWTGLSGDFFDKFNRIRYMGVLKPEEVSSKLLEYDALVLPTYLNAEGYSGVIFEAYASGLPVIASRWLSLPEIVIHEKTGLLVEPRDIGNLLAAMLRLSNDDELFHILRTECIEFVQDFTTEKQAGRFIEYCRLILF